MYPRAISSEWRMTSHETPARSGDFGDADTRFERPILQMHHAAGHRSRAVSFLTIRTASPDLDTFGVGLNYKFGAREERVVPLK
jgi:hypothetical protein